nr:mediator of RNA polymerase II transcription subunit 15-like [Drosophila takahashii]
MSGYTQQQPQAPQQFQPQQPGQQAPQQPASPPVQGAAGAVDLSDPFYNAYFETDLTNQIQQEQQQAAQQPQAPQQNWQPPNTAAAPQQPYYPPRAPAAPDNTAALVRSEIQRALAATAQQSQQARPQAEAPAPVFRPEDITLTPQEEQSIGGAAGRALLAKVARQAIAEYDTSRITPEMRNLRQQTETQAQAERAAREATTAQLMTVRVPDAQTLMNNPAYNSFASEMVYDAAAPFPVPRGEVLARAFGSGNVEYVAQQLEEFRRRVTPQQPPAPQQFQQPGQQQFQQPAQPQPYGQQNWQQPQTQQQPFPQQGQPVGVSYGQQNQFPTVPGAPSGSPGQSVPPSMAALMGGRRFNQAAAEKALGDFAARMRADPRDMDARVGYEKTYTLLRAAQSGRR